MRPIPRPSSTRFAWTSRHRVHARRTCRTTSTVTRSSKSSASGEPSSTPTPATGWRSPRHGFRQIARRCTCRATRCTRSSPSTSCRLHGMPTDCAASSRRRLPHSRRLLSHGRCATTTHRAWQRGWAGARSAGGGHAPWPCWRRRCPAPFTSTRARSSASRMPTCHPNAVRTRCGSARGASNSDGMEHGCPCPGRVPRRPTALAVRIPGCLNRPTGPISPWSDRRPIRPARCRSTGAHSDCERLTRDWRRGVPWTGGMQARASSPSTGAMGSRP